MQEPVIKSEIVALALGSNLGDRAAALHMAMDTLRSDFEIRAQSPIYETPAAYITDQPAFLNMVLLGTTKLDPSGLLRFIKQKETDVGRKSSIRFGPRLIDIDIIFYGALVSISPELTVPHPRLAEREFVLRPLADLAKDWAHPVTGLTVDAMLAVLPHAARRIGEKI
jgi:2-amino-4-hydroxy-6-hydroxymethyldihydropteridine diphosphokinase